MKGWFVHFEEYSWKFKSGRREMRFARGIFWAYFFRLVYVQKKGLWSASEKTCGHVILPISLDALRRYVALHVPSHVKFGG
jgi:hypothetical protein